MRRPLFPDTWGLNEIILFGGCIILSFSKLPPPVITMAGIALVSIYLWDRRRFLIVPPDTVIVRTGEVLQQGAEYTPEQGDQTVKLRPDSDIITVQETDTKTRTVITRSISLVWAPDPKNLSVYLENRDRAKLLEGFRKLLLFNFKASEDDLRTAFYTYAPHYGIVFDRVDPSPTESLDENLQDILTKIQKSMDLTARGRTIESIQREFDQFVRNHPEQMKNPVFAARVKNMLAHFIQEVMRAG